MGLYRGFGLSVVTFVPSRYIVFQSQGPWGLAARVCSSSAVSVLTLHAQLPP